MHNYRQLNLKNKLSKQPEQQQIHRDGDHSESYQSGGERGENGGQCAGIKKYKSVGTK